MEVGIGYLPTPDSHPVFFSDFESILVNTIEEALLLPQLQDAEKLSLAQIKNDLLKQQWSRIAHTSLNEYFLIA